MDDWRNLMISSESRQQGIMLAAKQARLARSAQPPTDHRAGVLITFTIILLGMLAWLVH